MNGRESNAKRPQASGIAGPRDEDRPLTTWSLAPFPATHVISDRGLGIAQSVGKLEVELLMNPKVVRNYSSALLHLLF